MIKIVTKVDILKKSPQEVFDFLLSLDKQKYIAMAPNAHKDFKILKPIQKLEGSIYYFHEKIGNLNLNHTWLVTKAKRSEYIIQKAQMIYPVIIEIYLTKTKQGTELTQNLLIGFNFLGLERIVDWFIRLFVLTPKQEKMLHNHTVEEFSSLERLA